MKKSKLFITGVILTLSLTGCGRVEEVPSSVPSVSVSAKETETSVANPEPVEAEITEGGLTKEEIEWYTEFLARDYNYAFLLSDYSDPLDVDIDQIIYNGDPNLPVTGADYARYKELTGYDAVASLAKITDEKLDEILTEAVGHTRNEMRNYIGMSGMRIIRDYDNQVYYIDRGDTNYFTYDISDGCHVTDEIVVLQLVPSDWCNSFLGTGYHVSKKEVAIETTGEHVHFLSCRDLTDEDIIEKYCFDLTLWGKGDVKLYSYSPKAGNEDVTFKLIKDGNIYQTLTGQFKDNLIDMTFNDIEDMGFTDYNSDGFLDMMAIVSYELENNTENLEYKVYTANANGNLIYDANATAFVAEHYDGRNVNEAFEGLEYFNGADDTWKTAYAGALYSGEFGSADAGGLYGGGYSLIFLDGDNIPELVYAGDCEATGCQVLTFNNGKTDMIAIPRLYFNYIPGSGLLDNSEGNMGFYWDTVIELKDGVFNIIAEGTYEFKPEADYDAEGDDAFIYKWNGNTVKEAKYNESLNTVYDTSQSVEGYQWDALLSYDEVLKYLNGEYQESF